MKFRIVDSVSTVVASKALLDAVVATKGTTKRVVVDLLEGQGKDYTRTLVRGLRKALKKVNLGLRSEAGEGTVALWTTGDPPKPHQKKAKTSAPAGL